MPPQLFNPEPAATADFTPHITGLSQPSPRLNELTGDLTAVAAGSEGIHQLPRGVRGFCRISQCRKIGAFAQSIWKEG
jgi:hypothetical protein